MEEENLEALGKEHKPAVGSIAVNSYTQPLFEFLKPWAACSRLKEINQHRKRSFLTENLIKVTKDYLVGACAAVVPGDLLSVTQMMQLSGPSVSAPVTRVDHTTTYEGNLPKARYD